MNTTKNSGEQNSLNNRHSGRRGGKSDGPKADMLILRYMREEREIRKKHRRWEDMFLFGIFAFLAVILCLLFGISGAPGEGRITDMSLVSISATFFMLAVFLQNRATFRIIENNIEKNIFEKYIFVPRKARYIWVAKALVMIKDAAALTMAGQAAALLINLAVNKGRFAVFPETFAPLYMGAAGILILLIGMECNYAKAYDKRYR